MNHEWQQFDHHNTKQCLLSDDEERKLIELWQHSDKLQSFDDVIIEAQQVQGVAQ